MVLWSGVIVHIVRVAFPTIEKGSYDNFVLFYTYHHVNHYLIIKHRTCNGATLYWQIDCTACASNIKKIKQYKP